MLPKGYSQLPDRERWDIIQGQIDMVGMDATFGEFAKLARYRFNTSRGEVYESDLDLLMASLPEIYCADEFIFSCLTNKCIKNTSVNRRKAAEVRERIQHLPKIFHLSSNRIGTANNATTNASISAPVRAQNSSYTNSNNTNPNTNSNTNLRDSRDIPSTVKSSSSPAPISVSSSSSSSSQSARGPMAYLLDRQRTQSQSPISVSSSSSSSEKSTAARGPMAYLLDRQRAQSQSQSQSQSPSQNPPVTGNTPLISKAIQPYNIPSIGAQSSPLGLSKINSVMLAEKFNGNVKSLNYPVSVSIKKDGVRCIMVDGKLLSRGLIDVPNKIIVDCLTRILPDGFDMELCVNNSLRETVSVTRSSNKTVGSLDVYVIDWVTTDDIINRTPFQVRYKRIQDWVAANKKILTQKGACENIRVHTDIQYTVDTPEDMQRFYDRAVENGEEGVMIRNLNGAYVTSRSNNLLKWKRSEDDEGLIVDLVLNDANKELEAFVLEWNGARFKISSGLNARTRKMYYEGRNLLIGQLLKFTYQDISRAGVNAYRNAPRHPVILMLRDRADL